MGIDPTKAPLERPGAALMDDGVEVTGKETRRRDQMDTVGVLTSLERPDGALMGIATGVVGNINTG